MTESVPGQVEAPAPPTTERTIMADHADAGPVAPVVTTDPDPGPQGGTVSDAGGDGVAEGVGPEGSGVEYGESEGDRPEEGPASAPAPVSTSSPVMGDYRMALIAAVNVDLPNQHPTVVLRESESPRRQLSFSIGFQDAVVLTHAMRRIPTPRPLTHELMSQVLQGFDIDVVAVRLVGRQGAIYFAELDLRGRTGRSVHSCRPSDGLTVALLQPVSVPILIDRRLFEMDGDVTPPGPAG